MLKLLKPCDIYDNFKCGEIFCKTPTVYNVTCSLCGSKMHLEQFASHFQVQHLTLAEEELNVEELERKRQAKLAKDDGWLDNMPSKEVDPIGDPIKEEQLLDEEEFADEDQQIEAESLKRLDINEGNGFILKIEVIESVSQQNEQNLEKNSEDLLPKINNTKDNVKIADEREKDERRNEISEAEQDDNFDLTFPCNICNRSYSSKCSLQKHKYTIHNPNKMQKRTSKEPKIEHKCDECQEIFRSARDLRGHKWKHTGIFCDICGKPFTQTGNMMRHKIRHTGIKAHKCQECDRSFFTDKELKSHMISHTGVMPVICEICGRRCRDRGVLTAHMRRHTGERPAKCEVCGKSFYSFHDLNVHAVTHTSERPFKCDICGSTFQRKKALRVHKLLHTKDRKHICRVCGKGFAHSGGLNSHMRTHDAALEKQIFEIQPVIPIVIENRKNDNEQFN
uniref:C2H2-type domain-containing protein n=1 Tax=Glossina palpalis gambiensis TaxID=67801 RepID=A0A1B0AN22_9MUSC